MIWSDILPANLPKHQRHHKWVFAILHEHPSERTDNQYYTGLLFCNTDRTIFGVKEYFDLSPGDDLCALAGRIVRDEQLRASLVSDDPALPKLWKRH